jgi:O-antigen ligase
MENLLRQQDRATGSERLAVLILQAGAVAVVLAALPFRLFELDRFFVPKEVALHAAATLAAVLCVAGVRRFHASRADWFLAGFLLLGAASAALATNPWAAVRALGISISGAMLFWSARGLSHAGLRARIVNGLALAVAVGAATSLLQTYGVVSDYFSLNRAPGGTFGNRNFVAHLCAFGLPVLVFAALRARGYAGFLLGALGVAMAGAVLFLTRSRAAWLALAVVLVALLPFAWRARRMWSGALAGRAVVLLLFTAGGAAAGALLPNELHWKSDNPYMETARGLVNAKEGSGHGRVLQYRHTAEIAMEHPVLGVGPGNWGVHYPRYVSESDPSMSSEPGVTSNPWPSSDLMAYLSERGAPALLLLVLFFVSLAGGAWRWLRDAHEPEEMMAALALTGTLVGALVTGAFDAVMLLPAPAMIVWTALGALAPPLRAGEEEAGSRANAFARFAGALGVLVVGLALTAKSAAQAQAMAVADASRRPVRLEQAAALDPGSYRIHLMLAEAYGGNRNKMCPHAQSAHALFPAAGAARQLASRCRGSSEEPTHRRRHRPSTR